jgi:hypothetical protein
LQTSLDVHALLGRVDLLLNLLENHIRQLLSQFRITVDVVINLQFIRNIFGNWGGFAPSPF